MNIFQRITKWWSDLPESTTTEIGGYQPKASLMQGQNLPQSGSNVMPPAVGSNAMSAKTDLAESFHTIPEEDTE
jgi:hypothetical protein